MLTFGLSTCGAGPRPPAHGTGMGLGIGLFGLQTATRGRLSAALASGHALPADHAMLLDMTLSAPVARHAGSTPDARTPTSRTASSLHVTPMLPTYVLTYNGTSIATTAAPTHTGRRHHPNQQLRHIHDTCVLQATFLSCSHHCIPAPPHQPQPRHRCSQTSPTRTSRFKDNPAPAITKGASVEIYRAYGVASGEAWLGPAAGGKPAGNNLPRHGR